MREDIDADLEPDNEVVPDGSEPDGAAVTIACLFLVLCVCVVSVAVAFTYRVVTWLVRLTGEDS